MCKYLSHSSTFTFTSLYSNSLIQNISLALLQLQDSFLQLVTQLQIENVKDKVDSTTVYVRVFTSFCKLGYNIYNQNSVQILQKKTARRNDECEIPFSHTELHIPQP